MLEDYRQYKEDLFTKLDFTFLSGKKILDVGCGDGTDALIFRENCGLDVYGLDVYKHPEIEGILGQKFILTKKGIFNLPYVDNEFDYVFLHDVLHHIDEGYQRYETHVKGLQNLLRIVRPGGSIIIVEANRYNPLFYPHMVKKLGHEHFTQKYFKEIINEVLPQSEFKFFEAHLYPKKTLWFWKIYEFLMEKFSPKQFLAYNVAIYTK